jgi:hypothetical protein
MEKGPLALKDARHEPAQDRGQTDQQSEEQGHLKNFIHFHGSQLNAADPEYLIKMAAVCVKKLLMISRNYLLRNEWRQSPG